MIDGIDWSRPWFRSVRLAVDELDRSLNWRAAMNRRSEALRLENNFGQPVRFVEQRLLPNDASYEQFIHETGQVPTRDNLHDFFNALVWLTFPAIKAQLNSVQANEIVTVGIDSSRGAVRDAATLFDENAALLVIRDSSRALLDALRSHNWQFLFVEQRCEFLRNCDVWLFGHALLEKLIKPYKAITAHAWVVFANDEYFQHVDVQRCEWLDRTVAGELQRSVAESIHPRRFTPLPVLGVPGWWPGQDNDFYADERVFRPGRLATLTQL